MANQLDGGVLSAVADGNIGVWERVALSGVASDGTATIVQAGIGSAIGVAQPAPGFSTFVAGDLVSVRLFSQPGTLKVKAATSLTAGALAYAAASGKVSSAATGGGAVGLA